MSRDPDDAAAELRALLGVHGALRRIATRVAHGAPPDEIFDAVTVQGMSCCASSPTARRWLQSPRGEGTTIRASLPIP